MPPCIHSIFIWKKSWRKMEKTKSFSS